uniref:Uncharacterized protein n=1 Tax=Rhizophora mucronata TaxID=61149 RepID=A0A2P2N8Z3_RHIMU
MGMVLIRKWSLETKVRQNKKKKPFKLFDTYI